MLKQVWKWCLMLSLILWGLTAGAFPLLTGQVVDEAHILSAEQKTSLTQTLQQANPHQVVAVSLSTLEGKEIEEYGVALGRHWGIGRKEYNDGVLIIIAPNQRQMRIEVGYGLEGILTDAKCSQIINRIMLPLAKQGKYADSLIKGSEAVINVLSGESIPGEQYEIGLLEVIVFLILFALSGAFFNSGSFHGGGGSFGGGGSSGRW